MERDILVIEMEADLQRLGRLNEALRMANLMLSEENVKLKKELEELREEKHPNLSVTWK